MIITSKAKKIGFFIAALSIIAYFGFNAVKHPKKISEITPIQAVVSSAKAPAPVVGAPLAEPLVTPANPKPVAHVTKKKVTSHKRSSESHGTTSTSSTHEQLTNDQKALRDLAGDKL